jgi:polyisoprenoid-binding protein YceI
MSAQDQEVRRKRRWPKVLGALIALGVLGATAGPWVYINVIREKAPAAFAEGFGEPSSTTSNTQAPSTAAATSATTESTWTVTAPSEAGYRVEEILAGQNATAVGRTTTVEGTVTLLGTELTAAEINVDLSTVKSDSGKRDAQFAGRIMNTDEFPIATFTLSEPVSIGAVPLSTPATKQVAGVLALRGEERPITLSIQAAMNGANAIITGSTEIVFADWGIPDPSIGPIKTEDRGTLEFNITLAPA